MRYDKSEETEKHLIEFSPHRHDPTNNFHPIPLTKPKPPMRLVAVDNGFQNTADTLFLVGCNGRYSHWTATGKHTKTSLCTYRVEVGRPIQKPTNSER
jgi:hypothetical protein